MGGAKDKPIRVVANIKTRPERRKPFTVFSPGHSGLWKAFISSIDFARLCQDDLVPSPSRISFLQILHYESLPVELDGVIPQDFSFGFICDGLRMELGKRFRRLDAVKMGVVGVPNDAIPL